MYLAPYWLGNFDVIDGNKLAKLAEM